jgi:hypothetical protein
MHNVPPAGLGVVKLGAWAGVCLTFAGAAAVHYAQEPKSFLDFVRTIYVAIGCKVFPSPGAVQAFLGHEYEHLASERGWTSDDSIWKGSTEAESEGFSKTSQLRTCDNCAFIPDSK